MKRDRRYTLALACTMLLAIGITGSVQGPALDDLAENTGSTLGDMGALFTMGFVGGWIASLLIGTLIDRMGFRPVLLAGVALMVPGVIGVSLSPTLWLLLAFGLVMGLGIGAMDVTSNLMVASVYAGANVGVLNLLHVFWGIGSVTGPALASLSLRLFDNAIPAMLVGMMIMLGAAPFMWRLPRAQGHKPAADPAGEPRAPFSYRVPLLWALGLLMLLYVGLEIGLGGWSKAYMERTTSLNAESAALVTSTYWLALTGGRVAGVFWGDRFAPHTVLTFSLTGMATGGALLAISTGSIAATVAAVVIVGGFAGPVFPTIVSITTDAFPLGPGRATSLVVAMGSIGGAALPWIQGQLLDGVSPAASVIFVAIGLLVALGLNLGIRAYARVGTLSPRAA